MPHNEIICWILIIGTKATFSDSNGIHPGAHQDICFVANLVQPQRLEVVSLLCLPVLILQGGLTTG